VSTRSPIELLRTRVGEFLGMPPEDVPGETNLILLGLSSLNVMRLHSQLRRSNVLVDFDEMIATPTLDAWVGQVRTVLAERADT
jgi:aryl carrier-like protein